MINVIAVNITVYSFCGNHDGMINNFHRHIKHHIQTNTLYTYCKSTFFFYLSFLNLIRTECLDGKHGQNCEEHCSQHCMISGKCDRVTGHCIGGCQDGWKNAQCDQGTI